MSTVNFNWISDATVVDGHIFMTLSGSAGLYLFGAPAPVIIPEPTTWTLLIISLAAALAIPRRGRRT